MSHAWKSGEFDRTKLHRTIRHFAPAHAVENLVQLDLELLRQRGKRLLLLDVDNTLVKWRGEEFAPAVVEWIERAKSMDFKICIISNTRRVERLARIAGLLGVETVRGRFKPSRAMYRLALIKFQCKPEEAIMVGDQMMTDILGANRAGIEAIWVRRMEGKEFAGTKVNRAIEAWLTSFVYEALVTPIDEPEGPAPKTSLKRQIVKFLIVGGSSFAVDYCVRMTLMFAIPYGSSPLSEVAGQTLQTNYPSVFGMFEKPGDAFYPIAAFFGAVFGIANSFIWNRSWTFQIKGKEGRAEQLRRFVVISAIGAAMNLVISSFLNHSLPGDAKQAARMATVIAALIVAFWNFAAQRMYAFRSRPTPVGKE